MNSFRQFEQEKIWLKLCRENHTLCNTTLDRSTLKLIRTCDLDTRPEYIAFSHCRGVLETMRSSFLQAILSTATRHHHDAQSRHVLGHLDRLPRVLGCGADHRAHELALQRRGCFHTRSTQSLKPVKIGVSSRTAPDADWISARRDDVFDFERNADLAPLNTREWCRGRSASELNPHGYTYKTYPEDFKDWYMPDLTGYVETRTGVEHAEKEGRGLSWANAELVRRHPPAIMIDPDNEGEALSAQVVVWQRKRGFWKNDERVDEQGGRDRAGFRAAFETLQSATKEDAEQEMEPLVGRYSFSQMCYGIVESYSRVKLTAPTDKLIALKGIQDEVARATDFTYLYGLRRERFVTDLLWFAIEGPGQCLLTELGVSVAPTWSWASVDAPVALDLLPEILLNELERKQTLVKVTKVSISTNNDVRTPNIYRLSSLMCIPFLILDREKSDAGKRSSSEDIQGLVLRPVTTGGDYNGLDVYERVGYFTTSYVSISHASEIQGSQDSWGKDAASGGLEKIYSVTKITCHGNS
ncbi:HET-domain-containing protein [Xylariaceae sp. FL1651]|nr:HET-domain-containing protein [Xylariaceae sp. FL1651]